MRKKAFIELLFSISLIQIMFSASSPGQQKDSNTVNDANITEWKVYNLDEYENIYHFGISELESDLILLHDDNKFYAQIKSGSWQNDGTLWLWDYENLTNVRIEGDKFYSDQTDGEFILYDNGKEKVKGLKVFKPWNNYPNDGKFDVGFVSISVEKYFPGKYPQASYHLLNRDELTKMSKSDLEIMLNEIYARYGYIFKEGSKMDNYFKKQKWYSGQHVNVNSFLNQIEKSNVKLIQMEKES